MKKFLSLILCLFILACPLMVGFAQKKPVLVLLGDSIAEGYGVANPKEASYGRILADTNNYTYYNFAKAARTSDGLIENINLSYVQDAIKEADIISVSIGGNDYLCDDHVVLIALEALTGTGIRSDELTEKYCKNLEYIINTIYTLNPDVTLFVQHEFSSWHGLLGMAYKRIVTRINNSIDKYAKEHPGTIKVVPIDEVMEGHKEWVASDTIHPNDQGNIEIAKFFQKILVDNGLATATDITVNVQGVNTTYYQDRFGEPWGTIIMYLVKTFTGNL